MRQHARGSGACCSTRDDTKTAHPTDEGLDRPGVAAGGGSSASSDATGEGSSSSSGAAGEGSPGPALAGEPQHEQAERSPLAAATPIFAAVAVLASVVALGVVHREELTSLLQSWVSTLDVDSPSSVAGFWVLYVCLELVGVPALPLTLSAGALFGATRGVGLVATAGLVAAVTAFTISRYFARSRVSALLAGNKQWASVDAALKSDSWKVVLLIRLSPLLPFALSNYAFGLTRIELMPYVLGTAVGVLPGTVFYVLSGSLGKSVVSDVMEKGFQMDEAFAVVPVLLGAAVAAFSARKISELLSAEVQEEPEH